MTKIVASAERLYLHAEGHAGSAPKGEDLICAGISAMTQTLLNVLSDEEEKGHLTMDWTMEPGRIRIRVTQVKSWKYGLIAKSYFTMAITGLRDMAGKYPEYIEIEEVQESGNV